MINVFSVYILIGCIYTLLKMKDSGIFGYLEYCKGFSIGFMEFMNVKNKVIIDLYYILYFISGFFIGPIVMPINIGIYIANKVYHII